MFYLGKRVVELGSSQLVYNIDFNVEDKYQKELTNN